MSEMGQKAEVQARNGEVRFSLKNRHRQAGLSGPKSAKGRHRTDPFNRPIILEGGVE